MRCTQHEDFDVALQQHHTYNQTCPHASNAHASYALSASKSHAYPYLQPHMRPWIHPMCPFKNPMRPPGQGRVSRAGPECAVSFSTAFLPVPTAHPPPGAVGIDTCESRVAWAHVTGSLHGSMWMECAWAAFKNPVRPLQLCPNNQTHAIVPMQPHAAHLSHKESILPIQSPDLLHEPQVVPEHTLIMSEGHAVRSEHLQRTGQAVFLLKHVPYLFPYFCQKIYSTTGEIKCFVGGAGLGLDELGYHMGLCEAAPWVDMPHSCVTLRTSGRKGHLETAENG